MLFAIFFGAFLSWGGGLGKEGLLCRKWYLFFRLLSLGRSQEGFPCTLPMVGLSY